MTTATKKPRRPQMTQEQRAEQIEALTNQLNTAVEQLTSSDAWLSMLRISSQFHNYSFRNMLLLWLQAEQRGMALTRVAGFQKWISLGRHVIKGAKALKVFAPRKYRLTPEEAAKIGPSAYDGQGRPKYVIRGFKLESVFDISQTEGEPLPEQPDLGYVTGDTPDGAWEALAAMVAGLGFLLTELAEDGGARGHTNYTDRIVNIDPTYPLPEKVHILVHELGHALCDHENREIMREQRETEAESVAYVVCSALGLDLGDVSTVYVAGWSDGDAEIIQSAAEAIHKAAQVILRDLEPDEDE